MTQWNQPKLKVIKDSREKSVIENEKDFKTIHVKKPIYEKTLWLKEFEEV